MEVNGTVTYALDGDISLTKDTVITNVFEDGIKLTITANSDTSGSIIFKPEDGLTIKPETDNKLSFAVTYDNTTLYNITSISGTLNYKDGVVTFSDGTKISMTDYEGYTSSISVSGGSTLVESNDECTTYTVDEKANVIITWNDTLTWQASSGTKVIDYYDGGLTLCKGAIFVTNDNITAFKLEEPGTYTLNGNTITATEDNVKVNLSNYDTVSFDVSAGIIIAGHSFSGDAGTMIQVKSGEISMIMYKKGTATIDGETFELTEDVASGIEVKKTSDGFTVSHIFTSEEAQKYDDADTDVGKTFTENVTVSGDDSYNIKLHSMGISKITGISNNANVKAIATLDGNTYENGTNFTVETDEAGTINFGTNSYKTDDDSVSLEVNFDKNGNGTVSEISELVGTISGDFGDIENINSTNIFIHL